MITETLTSNGVLTPQLRSDDVVFGSKSLQAFLEPIAALFTLSVTSDGTGQNVYIPVAVLVFIVPIDFDHRSVTCLVLLFFMINKSLEQIERQSHLFHNVSENFQANKA